MSHITQKTDKYTLHNYYSTYKRLVAEIKVNKLLEIGIGGYQSNRIGGDSLFSWHELVPKAKLVALDYYDKSLIEKPHNSKVYRGSQEDPIILEEIIKNEGAFDLIIDDGSHISKHIIFSFEKMFPHLNNGGVYIIEDIQTSYWKNYEGNLCSKNTSMNYFKDLADSINAKEVLIEHKSFKRHLFSEHVQSIRFEHNLIIIHKNRNDYPSNFDFNLDHIDVSAKILELQSHLEENPNDVNALYSLTDILMHGKEIESALKVCNKFLGHEKTNFRIMMQKAKCLKSLKLNKELCNHLKECLLFYPDEILFNKMILPHIEQCEKFKIYKTIALHVNSENIDVFNFLNFILNTESLNTLHKEVNALKENKLEIEIFDYFSAVANNSVELAEEKIEYLHNNAPDNLTLLFSYFNFLLKNKMHGKIIEKYARLNEVLQDNLNLRCLYINALLGRELYLEAEQAIYSGLLRHNSFRLWNLLSVCKQQRGEVKQAAAFAIQALNLAPNNKSLIKRAKNLKDHLF